MKIKKMKISSIFKSKNGKQVVILYFSTIIGVFLGILSSVINTRFLSPTDYGDVRYVQNIINFFSCIFLLGYFVSGSRLLAVNNNKEENSGIKGVMVVFLLKTIIALMVVMVLCYFFHIYIKENINASLFLVSIPVCAQPLMLNYINTTAQGDNQVDRIAYARLLPAFLYVIIAYWLYSSYGASSSFMIILQWGIACVILTLVIYSTRPKFKNQDIYKRKLVEENKKYGVHLYFGSLAMVATQYISGMTLGLYNTDNKDVAFYTLALTISMPLSMLPSIVGTTYFKQFATTNYIEKKVFNSTVLVTLMSLVLYVIIIQPIVAYLYPASYASVGVFASILALGKCIHGIGDMINRFLGAHGCGKEIRNASFATGAWLVLGSVVAVYFIGIWGAIITNILGSTIYFGVLLTYYRKFIKA